MSLARNPNMMMYSVAGREAQPREKMHVKSNVYMPGAEIGEDFDGRTSFSAPNEVYRRKRSWDISFNSAALIIGITLFAMLMMVCTTYVQKTKLVQEYNTIINTMRATQRQIDETLPEVMAARDSSVICYRAAQELGMVASQGVEVIEIYAPDTRPAASSLSAGYVIASLVN